ncbi:hypothetical protein MPSEU_000680000 [Mayamaea pseudoterrestris]|nr:hypothetical protein MPSEU_000680000 [Mayamaea pseudoterrestris]
MNNSSPNDRREEASPPRHALFQHALFAAMPSRQEINRLANEEYEAATAVMEQQGLDFMEQRGSDVEFSEDNTDDDEEYDKEQVAGLYNASDFSEDASSSNEVMFIDGPDGPTTATTPLTSTARQAFATSTAAETSTRQVDEKLQNFMTDQDLAASALITTSPSTNNVETVKQNSEVNDPKEEMKRRKLQKLIRRSKYPSFLELITANYDTEGSDDDHSQDETELHHDAAINHHSYVGTRSVTVDVDLMLGLKTKEQAAREQQNIRANRPMALQQTIQDEGYYEGSVGLSLPEDPMYLSDLHCWIRNSLEFFSATSQNAMYKLSSSIAFGRVGVRCIYCQRAQEQQSQMDDNTAIAAIPAGAISFPANLAAIYNLCQQKPQLHWENNCPHLPPDEKIKLQTLLQEHAVAKRVRRDLPHASYYYISAKRIGLVNHDTGSGIRFGRDLQLSPLALDICRKQYAKESHVESSNNASASNAAAPVSMDMTRITASPEAEAVLAEALLEPDSLQENLSRSADKSHVTDFIFLLIRQMQICHVLPLDFSARGKRAQGLRLGLAGFCCRHCGTHDPHSSCRSFTSAADNLSSSITTSFAGHLSKCLRVPVELKQALQAYKKLHGRQLAQLPYGAQRRLIHELWTRMREADVSVEEMTTRMASMPAAFREEARPDDKVDHDRLAYPEAFPRCTDEGTQILLEEAAKNWDEDPSENNLIIPSERFLVSEYVYLALRQVTAAQPSSDPRGRSMAGIQCRHCLHQPQTVSPVGRSFPTAPDNFASALNTSLNQHFQNCQYVSAELKIALSNVRKLHSLQCSSLKFGAQRRFFNILYQRLSQLTETMSEIPALEIDAVVANAATSLETLLFDHGFMQVGDTFQCIRCRMVPWHLQFYVTSCRRCVTHQNIPNFTSLINHITNFTTDFILTP